MKVWIDIVNSPHVLFFQPIIKRLKKQGHKVLITSRNAAQTVELLGLFDIVHKVIGLHCGKSRMKRIGDFPKRTRALIKFAHKNKPGLAVSLSSPWQAAAARFLKIPSMVIMDYEYQPANHLSFRLADRVMVPEVFDNVLLRRYGANPVKVIRYTGLKEQVYLSDFVPDSKFFDKINIDRSKVVVTVRPPATMTLYHHFENPFFERILNHILNNDLTTVVVLPRSLEQKRRLHRINNPNLLIPDKALDGRNLLYYSDLVISAGGTMNREAVVLGVPVYTIFKGKMAGVDKYLINIGKMMDFVRNPDLNLIKLEKKKRLEPLINKELLPEIVDKILEIGVGSK